MEPRFYENVKSGPNKKKEDFFWTEKKVGIEITYETVYVNSGFHCNSIDILHSNRKSNQILSLSWKIL